MGTVRNKYKATSSKTGEVIIGTARELSAKIGVVHTTIYDYACRGLVAKNEWAIELADMEMKSAGDYDLQTVQVMLEWDEFTEPVRQYLRRRNRICRAI